MKFIGVLLTIFLVVAIPKIQATPHKFKIESLNKNTASIYDLFKDSTFIAKIGEVDDEDTKRECKGKARRPSRKLASDEIFV